ncbi:hypothetical protein [Metamycoplasma neophronis]|nr:hypothetical protein [Metamycoplasma neophronis]
MAMCKIKTIPQDTKTKLSKAIFDRQRLFSFTWVFVFLAFMIMVSPQTFEQAALINKDTHPLNQVQKLFLLLPTVLASFAAFIECFFILTNAKGNRVGLNDKFSRTFTVYINKFDEIEEELILEEKIKPVRRELPHIEYEN